MPPHTLHAFPLYTSPDSFVLSLTTDLLHTTTSSTTASTQYEGLLGCARDAAERDPKLVVRGTLEQCSRHLGELSRLAGECGSDVPASEVACALASGNLYFVRFASASGCTAAATGLGDGSGDGDGSSNSLVVPAAEAQGASAYCERSAGAFSAAAVLLSLPLVLLWRYGAEKGNLGAAVDDVGNGIDIPSGGCLLLLPLIFCLIRPRMDKTGGEW